MKQLLNQINQKKERFKLIEEALYYVVEDLEQVINEEDLGLDTQAQADYKECLEETGSSYEHLNFLANKLIEIYKARTDEKFWEVYKASLVKAEANLGLAYKAKYEQKHIDNAIQNAFYFFFGLFNILPKIYRNTFNRELERKDFEKLILNSNKFSKAMSIIHFDMFRSFLYSSTQTKSGAPTKLHQFMPDSFEISEDLEITMSAAALARAKTHTQRLLDENRAEIGKESPTLGCPAKFVTINESKQPTDLIDLIHKWVYLVMKKYFL